MGIVFRQSAKNLIIVAFGAVLGALVVWLSTKFISKQGFGYIRSIGVYAVILSQLLLLGLNSTLIVFTHRLVNDMRKRKLLLSLTLLIPVVAAGIFAALYFIFRNQILHHYQKEDIAFMTEYFAWLPLFIFFFIFMTVLEQYLGSQMRVAVSAFVREIVVRVLNIALILFFAMGYISLHTLITGTILIYGMPMVVFLVLCFRIPEFGFSFRFRDFSVSEYKEIGHFAWYHLLLGAVLILMTLMDSALLPIYDHSGLKSAAVYGTANFIISFLLMPSKAFLPASFAAMAKAFAENDMTSARSMFGRASVNLLIPTLGIAVILCCNLQNAVAVIGNGKNYADIINVFLILMLGSLVNVATGMNDQVLSIANYYKFNFYVSVILITLLFGLIKFLVPRYGMYGAAWSATSVLIIFNIIKYVFVWKKLGMQPFSNRTWRVLVAALPALAVGYFFPYLFDPARHVYVHTFIDAGIRCALIAIIYIAMLLRLKPSPDLVEYVGLIKKNKRLY